MNMSTIVSIDPTGFNNDAWIEARVAAVDDRVHGALRTTLKYLYKDDGPINLPRDRMKAAEPYLSEAERIISRWLYTRTNGSLHATYGADALRAARTSRYRCQVCGFADARALNIDHVDGHIASTAFACLCANCHTIKSRKCNWSGKKTNALPLVTEEKAVQAKTSALAPVSPALPSVIRGAIPR